MYQKKRAAEEVPSESEALLDQAIELIAERGMRGATTRAVAERASVSPGLINYHFGSHRDFLLQALGRAAEQDIANWRVREEEFAGQELRPADLASILQAVLRDDFVAHRRLALVRWVCLLECERTGFGAEFLKRQWSASLAFWRRLLGEAGIEPALGDAVAGAFMFIGQGYLLNDAAIRFDPWATDLCDRLAERLLKAPLSKPGDSRWRRRAEEKARSALDYEEPGDQTQRRIIDGAVEIIFEQGADAITHRAIAERAGVSLSSMTHHFKSREEIVVRAYRTIYHRARINNPTFSAPPAKQSVDDFADSLLNGILLRTREKVSEGVPLQELMLAASRIDALKPTAIAMFASMGETTARVLSSFTGLRGDVDRLDAQILRALISGVFQAAYSQTDTDLKKVVTELARAIRHFYC